MRKTLLTYCAFQSILMHLVCVSSVYVCVCVSVCVCVRVCVYVCVCVLMYLLGKMCRFSH
jgi:hypothetical protein